MAGGMPSRGGLGGSSPRASIELSGLTKRFGEIAVDNIDLTVASGEFFSLLGPSGCGKTTTLRLIAGFEQPTSGRILLDGVDVSDVPPHRRNVNTVFQSYALFPFLTVFDNVAFGLRLGDWALTSQRCEATAAGRSHAVIRPERVRIEAHGSAGENRVPAMVERVVFLGAATQVILRLAPGIPLLALMQNDGERPDLAQGTPVHCYLPPDALRVRRDKPGCAILSACADPSAVNAPCGNSGNSRPCLPKSAAP